MTEAVKILDGAMDAETELDLDPVNIELMVANRAVRGNIAATLQIDSVLSGPRSCNLRRGLPAWAGQARTKLGRRRPGGGSCWWRAKEEGPAAGDGDEQLDGGRSLTEGPAGGGRRRRALLLATRTGSWTAGRSLAEAPAGR